MKKVICITIALCLVFASVLPVYAEAWTSQQATTVTSTVNTIASYLANFSTHFTDWVGVGANTSGMTSTWNAFYTRWLVFQTDFNYLASWLVPSGANSGTATMLDSIVVLTNYAMNHLPDISSIAGYVGSWMASNNNYLNTLKSALSNVYLENNLSSWTYQLGAKNAHYDLLAGKFGNSWNGTYKIPYIASQANGSIGYDNKTWSAGSPLGNIALLVNYLNDNLTKSYSYRWVADLTHYNDNLTTWDSQGSTLTQVAFTPDSAIQGLYRYLAFTQRDVARLAYVFANDEELEARELAQANQEQVLDDFIDPNGSGSVSPTDLGNMTDASDGFKSNFSTNVGSSHIWDVFDNSRYNWFTQQTKNQLDTTQQTRSLKAVQDDYPTPLLDNYYNEMLGIIGVDIND